jgi:hypothetical protein
MKLEFNGVEEVKDFVSQLKGTRGKKGEIDEPQTTAPAPVMPPPNPPQFAPNPSGFPSTSTAAVGFSPAATPETALVKRISDKIDSILASGQPPDAALNWFRQRCASVSPEAATATIDQIKGTFLARLPLSALEETAKLLGA